MTSQLHPLRWVSNGNCLKSLVALQGKPLNLCYLILNKDLTVINDRANLNLTWLSHIFDVPKDKRQAMMIDLMFKIPQKTFQWERKDTD